MPGGWHHSINGVSTPMPYFIQRRGNPFVSGKCIRNGCDLPVTHFYLLLWVHWFFSFPQVCTLHHTQKNPLQKYVPSAHIREVLLSHHSFVLIPLDAVCYSRLVLNFEWTSESSLSGHVSSAARQAVCNYLEHHEVQLQRAFYRLNSYD